MTHLLGNVPMNQTLQSFFKTAACFILNVSAIVVVKCIQTWLLIMATNYQYGVVHQSIVEQQKVLDWTHGSSHPSYLSILY